MTYGIYSLPLLKNNRIPLVGGTSENYELVHALQHEVMRNGYEFTDSTLDLLATCEEEVLTEIYNQYMSVFDTLVGSEKHKTFYPDFPDLPSRLQYTGELTEYIKDQYNSLKKRKLELIPDFTFKPIELCSMKYVEKLFTDVLYANQSPSKLDVELINFGLEQGYSFDFTRIVFKETMSYVGKAMFEKGKMMSRNATDLLRIYSLWCGGDPGLKTNTFFHKPRPEIREAFRAALEKCYNLEESFKMYEEKWKRVLYFLRPFVHKSRFPNLARYTDLVRNNSNQLRTFNSYVEEAIRTMDKNIFNLLRKRKGVFARRLNQLIDVYGITAFEEFMKYDHSPKRLVELFNYFESRRTSSSRSAILASQSSSEMVSYSSLKALPAKLVDSIQDRLLKSFPKPLKGDIYIDPKLYYRPLTTNNRQSEISLNSNVMGECFSFNSPYLRTFVHWEGRGIDIDFSGFLYDSTTKKGKKVGWNGHHTGKGFVYSGDNTGNFQFNSEYIDINFNELDKSYDWLVLDAVVYSRRPFSSIKDCKLGYGEARRPFGKNFNRNQVTQAQQITSTAQQCWIAGIHIPTKTFITMGFTRSTRNVTDNVGAVIQWLEDNLNPQSFEINWSKLNQGHILHLLAENVVDTPEEATKSFTEDTTSDEVASLI